MRTTVTTTLTIVAFLVFVGCMIRSSTAKFQSICAFADKNGGRLETVIVGYSRDKDGSGETITEYQVRLPDNSVVTETELYRRGLLRYW